MRLSTARPPRAPDLARLLACGALALSAPALSALSGAPTEPTARRAYPALEPPQLLEDEGPRFSTQVLAAWDAQADDWFGSALAIDGERAVVGIPYDDLAGGNSGSAAVFERGDEGWRQVDLLSPTRGARDAYFGMSVALSGDRCVIGAPWCNQLAPQAGCAYLFEWDGAYWYQRARLFPEGGGAGDNFGVSVALDGERILVGSRFATTEAGRTGAVYVFGEERGSWRQERRIVGSECTDGDEFGFALDLDGERLVVGAYAADASRGAAYVFRLDGGRAEELVRLTAPTPRPDDCFGLSVALHGEEVLVGAPWSDEGGEDSGAAYLYREGYRAWQLAERWTPRGARGGEFFGCAVDLGPEAALVGARYGHASVQRAGSATLVPREGGGWGEPIRLPRQFAQADDGYGLAVALEGQRALVAARQLDARGLGSGQGMCRWYEAPHRR